MMKRLPTTTLYAALCLLLCAGTGQAQGQGTSNRKMPVLSAAQITSLKGPDTNRNGLRDDLDREIKRLFPTTSSRRAATLYMAARLRELENHTVASALKLQHTKEGYLSCLINELADTWAEKVSLLSAISRDTEARLNRSIAFKKLLAGQVINDVPCPLPESQK